MERYQTGRFYNSFLVKMIRDFFLLLVVLLLIEVAARLCRRRINYLQMSETNHQLLGDFTELEHCVKAARLRDRAAAPAQTTFLTSSKTPELLLRGCGCRR